MSDPSLSPIGRALAGYRIRNRSSRAVARALTRLGKSLPKGGQRFARLGHRIGLCALSFYVRVRTDPGEPSRLEIANKRECRSRLCPSCERRRTRKLVKEMSALIDLIWDTPNVRALLLTLTTRSRPLSEAPQMYRDHDAALRRFWRNKIVLSHTLGQAGSIELAIRTAAAGTIMVGFHSHHLVVVDGERYFAGGIPALHQSRWRDLWREAARIRDYRPIVDVRAIRGPDGSVDVAAVKRALRETCKYILAPQSYVQIENDKYFVKEELLHIVVPLLHRKRLMKMDRCFMEAKKQLKNTK